MTDRPPVQPISRRTALARSGAFTGAAFIGALAAAAQAQPANQPNQPAGQPGGQPAQPASQQPERPLAVFVLRHAEPQGTSSGDPGLSVVGRERADRVGAMLRSIGVSRVLHTSPARARETGERIARRCGVGTGSYDAFEPKPLIERLIAAGGVWVIVGHSNTVPGLVSGLGGDPGTDLIPESQYDDLYMVVRAGGAFSARLRSS